MGAKKGTCLITSSLTTVLLKYDCTLYPRVAMERHTTVFKFQFKLALQITSHYLYHVSDLF